MQCPGGYFLSGTGLARNQNGGAASAYESNDMADLPHFGTLAHQHSLPLFPPGGGQRGQIAGSASLDGLLDLDEDVITRGK